MRAEFVLVDKSTEFFVGAEILAKHGVGATEPLRCGNQYVPGGLIFLLADDDGMATFHDPGLLGGDQLDPVTQIRLVVERDRHDDRNSRMVDDVGRVETTAETDLDDRHVGGLLGKEKEGGQAVRILEDGDLLSAIGIGDPTARPRREPRLRRACLGLP